jgi:hypothetical protein
VPTQAALASARSTLTKDKHAVKKLHKKLKRAKKHHKPTKRLHKKLKKAKKKARSETRIVHTTTAALADVQRKVIASC